MVHDFCGIGQSTVVDDLFKTALFLPEHSTVFFTLPAIAWAFLFVICHSFFGIGKKNSETKILAVLTILDIHGGVLRNETGCGGKQFAV
ncbi:MAG: hypothetical protein Aureis2KO_28040 [Aureisphaera sp.]